VTAAGQGPGRLLAAGRAADVYEAGPGLVLRRYRNPHVDATTEAAVMAHVAAAGYPVPRVESAVGPDLVMERVAGPTMLADLARRPWRLPAHAVTLADLHLRLGAIKAPPGLRAPLGPGGACLHLDLHPDNVLLGPDGPVVIDWTNAARGPVPAGVADTWLLIGAGRPEAGRAQRVLFATAQQLLARRFVRAAGADAARPFLPAALERRLADHNMRPAEIERMQALVTRESHRSGAGPSR
jgi:aminoglycoside phosphotransferase (APT) family kinase protein